MKLLDLDARRRQHLAERHALQVRVHRDLPLTVVAVDRRGAVVALELRDVAHFDGFAAGAGPGRDEQVAHHVRVPVRFVQPQQDLELVVAVLELRHLFAADKRAQVVGERVDVDAEVGRARAIHRDAQLGLRRLEVRVDVDDAGDRAHLLHQLHGVGLELLDVRTLNQNVEPVEPAATATAATAASTPMPGPRPPDEAPEMSVPPETLIRAPWYLRSI